MKKAMREKGVTDVYRGSEESLKYRLGLTHAFFDEFFDLLTHKWRSEIGASLRSCPSRGVEKYRTKERVIIADVYFLRLISSIRRDCRLNFFIDEDGISSIDHSQSGLLTDFIPFSSNTTLRYYLSQLPFVGVELDIHFDQAYVPECSRLHTPIPLASAHPDFILPRLKELEAMARVLESERLNLRKEAYRWVLQSE